MSERWKSFIRTALFFFVFMTGLELLSDYLQIGETAFEPLKSLKFYVGRIIGSLVSTFFFEFLFSFIFLKKQKNSEK